MAIRNQPWSDENESRWYPFDDGATLQDDRGLRPPLDLISGAKILVPDSVGRYVYVGALSVTRHLVTVIVLASHELDQPGTPVFSLSETLPITRHWAYQLPSLLPGAGGWISFGSGTEHAAYTGRFMLPRQSLLSPLTARSYKAPPVFSVGKLGGTGLQGLVRLSGGNDFEIVKECREVPGHAVLEHHEGYCGSDELGTQVREVAVFRLREKSVGNEQSVLETYSGPCAKRPSSRNCGPPEPVEFLGPVGPDCNGNVTIAINGCADMLAVREVVTLDDFGEPVFSELACGVVLACGLGMDDACVSGSRLPDNDGRLPGEYDDLCESVTYDSESEAPPPDEPDFSFDPDEAAEESISSFEDEFEEIGDYIVRYGNFQYADVIIDEEESVSTLLSSAVSRNVITYEPAVDTPSGYYRRVTARVQLLTGPEGALHNAAVVANYRQAAFQSNRFRYFVAEIDWDGHYRGFKMLRIAEFDGAAWINLFSVALPGLQLDRTYDLSLEIYPHPTENSAWLIARLVDVVDNSINVTIGPLSVSGYGPAVGPFGMGTNRAASRFWRFEVESILTAP